MFRLVMCGLILFSVNCVFAASYHVIQQTPVRSTNPYYREGNYYVQEILPRDLSALEKYSMNKAYNGDNPISRLERLENLAFGAVQEGNPQARYKNVETAILNRPKENMRRNALSRLTGYFTGQPTGITPNINMFNNNDRLWSGYYNYPASSGYNNQRYNQFSNGIFGRGYSLMNNSFGNGSSVRILD